MPLATRWLALLVLGSSAAVAQTPPDPPVPRDGMVRSTVSVRAIHLDAFATRNGEPVGDLRADEVILKLDGKVVPVDYFNPWCPAPPAVPGPPGTGTRHFLLILDEDHLLVEDRAPAHAAARRLLERRDPADGVAIAVLRNGRVRTLVPFGADTGTAARALDDLQRTVDARRVLGGAAFSAASAKDRTRNTLEQLQRAVRGLGAVPGRKELVLVSRGLDLSGGATDVSSRGGLDRELDALVDQANRSRVTVHSVGVARLEPDAGFT